MRYRSSPSLGTQRSTVYASYVHQMLFTEDGYVSSVSTMYAVAKPPPCRIPRTALVSSNMADSWQLACDTYQRAITASEVESKTDPENEPYRSKYRARELLREVRALLGPGAEEESSEGQGGDGDEGRLRAARLAVIEFRLGVNHTETEEMSAGEEHLVKAGRLLEKERLSHDCVSIYIQAQVSAGDIGLSSQSIRKCIAQVLG